MKIRAQISSQNNWRQTWHFISSVHKHHKHPNKKKPPPSPTGRIRQLRQPPRVLFLDSARTPQNVLWSVPIASGPMDQRPSRCFFFDPKKVAGLFCAGFFLQLLCRESKHIVNLLGEIAEKAIRSLAKSLLQFCFFITFSFQFMLQDFCPGCTFGWALPQASSDLVMCSSKQPKRSKHLANFIIFPETRGPISLPKSHHLFRTKNKHVSIAGYTSAHVWFALQKDFNDESLGPGSQWLDLRGRSSEIFMLLPSWSMKSWLVNEGILMKFKEKCLQYPYIYVYIYIYIICIYIDILYMLVVCSSSLFTTLI